MPGLDHRADQTRDADAVAAHLRDDLRAIGAGNAHAHRFRIFGAEIEDVPDLDAAPFALALGRHRAPGGGVVLFLGGGVEAGHFLVERIEIGRLVVVERGVDPVDLLELPVIEHLAFAGGGENDEFVAEIAADRPGIGHHWDRLQAHALEGAHIGQHHLAIGDDGGRVIEIEAVAVLHQEFAPAHHAEARAHLVAEFPLDMIQDLRQFPVGFD